jgi:hypothetical protein
MGFIRRRHRRDPLRHCPVCAAEAVGILERAQRDARQVAFELRCGNCGMIRGVVTSVAMAELFELRLERQCLYMRELADRRERERIARG